MPHEVSTTNIIKVFSALSQEARAIDRKAIVCVSRKQLKRKTGLGDGTVYRAVKALHIFGMIEKYYVCGKINYYKLFI